MTVETALKDCAASVPPEQWATLNSQSYLADSIQLADETTFSGSLRRRRIEDLLLLDIETDPYASSLSSTSESADFVGFSVSRKPYTERVTLRDGTRWTQQADVSLWDNADLFQSEILSPASMTVVLIPKSSLRVHSTAPFSVQHIISSELPSVHLLKELILAVAAQPDRLPAPVAAAARNGIVELLLASVCERQPVSKAAVSDTMRLSIERWVDGRLYLGSLSAKEAAEHHGISVRSLHRLYASSSDTFGALVRRRRLERARRDLMWTDDLVQTIAVRWGYADASHFITEFKRAHGFTPAEYRAAYRARVSR